MHSYNNVTSDLGSTTGQHNIIDLRQVFTANQRHNMAEEVTRYTVR